MDMVSVIVPAYNVEKSVGKCIQSLINQDYPKLEIILIDDGSTDNTTEIIEGYLKQDTRVHLIRKAHSGVSDTRNYGLHAANGKYIAFCDSDDMVHPKYISNMMKAVNPGIDLVICQKTNKLTDRLLTDNFSLKCFKLAEEYCTAWYEALSKYAVKGPVCKIFKKEIISQNNLFFNPQMCFGEDFSFVLDYMEYCNFIGLLDQELYQHNLGNGGLTFSISIQKIENLLTIYEKYHCFINHWGLADDTNMKLYYIEFLTDYYVNALTIFSKYPFRKAKTLYEKMSCNQLITKACKQINTLSFPQHQIVIMKSKKAFVWKAASMIRAGGLYVKNLCKRL